MRKFLLLFSIISVQLYSQDLDIQGHRGARGLLPENTIPAFIRAIDEGVTTLELDVVITKDKQVLVSHEPYMSGAICIQPDGAEITAEEAKSFNIYEMTYEEVTKFDCGSKGNVRFPEQEKMKVSKPLLSDVISKVEGYLNANNLPEVRYNIELKSSPNGDEIFHPSVEEFSTIVKELLDKHLPVERYTIQCFDFRVLKFFYENYQDVTLVALVENNKSVATHVKDLGFKPSVYSPYFKLLSKKIVEECHQMGIKVIPWTVNELEDMKAMVEMQVDGIITDYPNRAKALKEE